MKVRLAIIVASILMVVAGCSTPAGFTGPAHDSGLKIDLRKRCRRAGSSLADHRV
jgi:hypothetical protein